MVKRITFIMNTNETIYIRVNDEHKHTIGNDHKISANDIYNILDFSIGDKFQITYQNDLKIKPEVLSFFIDLINDIIAQVDNTFNFEEVAPLPEDHDHEPGLQEEDFENLP